MKGKIALEEHFATDEFLEEIKPWFTSEGIWEQARETICDIVGQRIELMDKAGIEKTILSLTAPAIQNILKENDAIAAAKRANDHIANAIKDHHDRFESFAALPTQNPEAAVAELTRCVKEYGFKGALVNGFCLKDDADDPIYLDDPRYEDFWAEVEKLGYPIYLHPRTSLPVILEKEFKGHNWMQRAAWGWHVQTGTHALRLIGSGLFDRYPGLNIVLGHMGELLPFFVWRTNNRVSTHPRDCKAQKTIQHYLMNNFYITTSGHCSTSALMCAIMEMGTDRIMFSTDYPYESMQQGADWFDNIPFCENDKIKMGRTNAMKLFNIK